ncbi:MORN repeat-containing protein [Rugamonas sp. DEMB1]|uniref:MORN repeat-containing protein n=1 Tax=Rugamonas sp. DEMB1 TaxID=3039386 RepID=UPI00244832CE|nr:hypothetical protein [Rugamonas sp. DEMB1]WGG50725.1 hypothetical protein QC826_30840 [Rugamonas sp. DEMB1]
MRPLFALPLLLLTLQAHGAEPQYLNAERDCRVADPQPQPGLSVTWEGACKDGYADGMGVLRWFLKEQPHGAYEGVLRAGRPNGPGFRLNPDNSSLQGDFVDGRLDGPGVYVTPMNGKLSATFRHGQPSGKVEFTYNNGDRYQGDWSANGPHGQGSMQFALGGSYQGFWLYGRMEGKGRILYPNGEQLDGDFEQGHLRGAAVPAAEPAQYTVKREKTGTHIPRAAATGLSVPPQLAYAQLTPAQQWTVKQPYRILQEADEPPYPLAGTGALVKAFLELPRKSPTDGEYRLNVLVGADGKCDSAEVQTAPTPALGQMAASILLVSKFKPAVCAGKPCAMRYPVNFQLSSKPN